PWNTPGIEGGVVLKRPRVLVLFVLAVVVFVAIGSATAYAQTPPAPPPPPAACGGHALGAADPCGDKTGSARDVAPDGKFDQQTFATVVDQVGKNKVAVNFTWTLLAGALVLFFQSGFALVETGFTRAKNASHTMMMNFIIFAIGGV